MQGPRLEFPLGYAPSEVVLLVKGAALLKISDICLRDAACLSCNNVSGILGVGSRRAWVRSSDECIAAPFDEIL